jgi:hypothetical protein
LLLVLTDVDDESFCLCCTPRHSGA